MQSAIDTFKFHSLYEAADRITKEAVDEAVSQVQQTIQRDLGIRENDDTAEELVAAVMHYVVRCRDEAQRVKEGVFPEGRKR